ncbi:MAG: hypothetical protein ACYC35_06065 [Pirellulales bacterium]
MKRILFLALAATVLAAGAGCCLDRLFCARPCAAPSGCGECGCESCGNDCATGCRTCKPGCKHGARGAAEEVVAGPPTGAVTYPYYTTRGPRDFLAKEPRSIGE